MKNLIKNIFNLLIKLVNWINKNLFSPIFGAEDLIIKNCHTEKNS